MNEFVQMIQDIEKAKEKEISTRVIKRIKDRNFNTLYEISHLTQMSCEEVIQSIIDVACEGVDIKSFAIMLNRKFSEEFRKVYRQMSAEQMERKIVEYCDKLEKEEGNENK